ncbi:MAG: winged helix DNA-binding domain-containing protein [bacterium]|nr:winged helix DNA-binding domain-containing protein [bacterium]
MATTLIQMTPEQVHRLWLARQGLSQLAAPPTLTRKRLQVLLGQTGGLQLDSVNVLDRAHYLTLWSRFGSYNRQLLDRWVYEDRIAYEYWGHEACILPISHLPFGLRRMRRFPPKRWETAHYWKHYQTNPESKRRVLRLLRQHGPLESADFDPSLADREQTKVLGWGAVMPKEDKRSLVLLWHAGKVAITKRKHFRKVFDLASKVYPSHVQPVSKQDFFDSWLLIGLSGMGIASEHHLASYFTSPALNAAERAEVIQRNLKSKRIREVRVQGFDQVFLAREQDLDACAALAEPQGTTLVCPFDSFMWSRRRVEEVLQYRYRLEIYVPEKKREFGYYVMPILHEGRLVGRVDPKLDRKQQKLLVKAVYLESSFADSQGFRRTLRGKLEELAAFLGARDLQLVNERT